MTQGDTGVAFSDHLKMQGESIDLTGANVQALMVSQKGTVLINLESAEILQSGEDQDMSEPNVRYVFSDADLETAGTHKFQWKVTFPSGRFVTRPPEAHQIKVVESLV